MPQRARPRLRHCPICGIAMQAKKSHEDLAHFDTFECLTCATTIHEQAPAGASRRANDDKA